MASVFVNSLIPHKHIRNLWDRSLPSKYSVIQQEGHNGASCEPDYPFGESTISRALRLLPLVLLPLTSILFWILGFAQGTLLHPEPDCLRRLSSSSPILEDLTIKLSVKQFNGSFMGESIFRKTASPEVDAAWAELGVDYRPVIIPQKYASSSGLLPYHVRVSDKYGGGFPANVEGLHHLHCLNLLRQSLYFNYEYYKSRGEGAFTNEEYVLEAHITHCLDILRQQLMCVVDIGVLGQIWWDKSYAKAFPDFNTKHVCRDFEAIRNWAQARQAPVSVPSDYLQAPRKADVFENIP